VVGQVNGTHVHKLSGQYVGELDKQMIVRKTVGDQGNLGNPGNPANKGHLATPANRPSVSYGYPDVSKELFG